MTNSEKKVHLREYRIQQSKILRMTEILQKYPNEAERCREKIRDAWQVREGIENEILSLQDNMLREILAQKYLCGHTLGQIAERMNYSKRQIERLHVKALEHLEIAG